jgi:hypothetical protein
MSRNLIFLTIVVMVLLASLLVGCVSAQIEPTVTQAEPPIQVEPTLTFTPLEPTPTPVEPTLTPVEPTLTLVEPTSTPSEPTPTPEPQIVWSDDFEDGDTEGWEEGASIIGDEYLVSEGALSFGKDGGDTRHPSTVSFGTWSFDVNISETQGPLTDITFIVSQLGAGNFRTIWVYIENKPNTEISLRHYNGSETITDAAAVISEGEKVTGWHHIDITRDEDENIKVYFDGELYLDSFIHFRFQSDYFYFGTYDEGPALDNVVVRNYVIDIQPPSE